MAKQLTWQDFLDQLTKSLLHDGTLTSTFKMLKNDKERANFCRTNPLISLQITDWLNEYRHRNIGNFQKSKEVALKRKNEGNKAFVSKDDKKAIELYNSALLYASKNDSALLYGNRSAVLFAQGMWQKCITDIEAAIAMNFPEKRVWKLFQRRGECFAMLRKFQESNENYTKAINLLKTLEEEKLPQSISRIEKLIAENNENTISKPSQVADESSKKSLKIDSQNNTIVPFQGWNDYITYGSSCLTIQHDSDQGRYVVANRDIPSGSVIISEKPYAAVLLSPWYKTHCTHCFVPVTLPFACHKCSQVVYCSEVCRKASWEEYHYFECQKLDLLENIGIARLALRVYLVTPKDRLNDVKSDIYTLSRASGCDSKGIYKGNYDSVFHLLTHSEKMAVEDVFQYSAAGILLLKILLLDGKFKEDVDHVGGLLIRHIQQLVCNAHAITSLEDTPLANNQNAEIIEQGQVRLATAIYPTTSLLNHSCEPTILNCFQKDRLVVKTVREVKAGEQIYNCYGPHFRRMDFTERQNALKQQYFFNCLCTHCLKGISADSSLNTFRCNKCDSSLYNHVSTKCNVDVSERRVYCTQQQDSYRKKFQVSMEKLQQLEQHHPNFAANARHALRLFLECVQIQEDVLFRDHRELSQTYDVIGRCHALLGEYEESIPFVSKSIAITEMHFGTESVEVTNEMLKLSDLYMAALQFFVDSKMSKKIKLHLARTQEVIEKTISLVDKNKEKNCEDMVVLKARLKSLVKLKYLSLSHK